MHVALIGFGNAGRTHYEQYESLGVKVSVVDEERKFYAQSLGLETYSSLKEVPDVDIVDICTPTNAHLKNIRQAVLLNLPIIVETPIVSTNADVLEISSLIRRHSKPIIVIDEYNKKIQNDLKYYAQITFIEVYRMINVDYIYNNPWFLDEEKSGGIALHSMIYDLNLLTKKYGKPTVSNVRGERVKHDCIDRLTAFLAFPSITTLIHSSWVSENKKDPIDIIYRLFSHKGEKRLSCNNYASENCLSQIKDAITRIQNNEPNPIKPYLDAIFVANDIKTEMQKGI